MIATRPLVLAVLAASLGAGAAVASDIYRYTDADGNVHYVDRPTGAPTEERLAIASKPTDPAQVIARAYPTSRDAQPADADDESERAPTRAERAAAARERAEKCQQYRDQLESFITSRRLYRQGEDGERVYLDEQEVLEARTKAEERVVEFCD